MRKKRKCHLYRSSLGGAFVEAPCLSTPDFALSGKYATSMSSMQAFTLSVRPSPFTVSAVMSWQGRNICAMGRVAFPWCCPDWWHHTKRFGHMPRWLHLVYGLNNKKQTDMQCVGCINIWLHDQQQQMTSIDGSRPYPPSLIDYPIKAMHMTIGNR